MNRQAARAGRARRADHDRTAPMSEIVFADGDVCVDAAIIAAGLGISGSDLVARAEVAIKKLRRREADPIGKRR